MLHWHSVENQICGRNPNIPNMKPLYFWLFGIAGAISSCGGSNGEGDAGTDSTAEKKAEVTETQTGIAYCLWDNIAVRATPTEDGKYLTSLAIGERVEFLDSTVTDESSAKKYEYTLVRLSDQKEGWARADFIFNNVRLAAVKEESRIYSRPDLLTASKNNFHAMDLVAIREAQDGWREVIGVPRGEGWYRNGWLPADKLLEGNVAARSAALLAKAMKQDSKVKAEMIQNLLQDQELTDAVYNGIEQVMLTDRAFFLNEADKEYFQCYFSEGGRYAEQGGRSKITINNTIYHSGWGWGEWEAFVLANCIAKLSGAGTDEYGDVDPELRIEKVKALSGIAPYTAQLSDGTVQFNHVNPDFVRWVNMRMIPHPDDDIYGVKWKAVYDALFREQARSWVISYLVYKKHHNARTAYEAVMESGGHCGWYVIEAYSEDGEPGVDGLQVGFWIRRNIDGSENAIWQGIKKVMLNYDREWFEQEWRKAEPDFGEYTALTW